MSLFAYSGDEGPSHYFSVRGGLENRYYGDNDRYGRRSTTIDMYPAYERYGRSQSRGLHREGHYPSVGSLDKFYLQPQMVAMDVYGHAYSQDNFNARDVGYRVERRSIPREYFTDCHRMENSRNAGYDNTMNHRYLYESNVRPGYESRERYDPKPYDRIDRERLYSMERFGYDNRYDGDRNHFPSLFTEAKRDSEIVHFDKERRSRSDAKRVSATISHDKSARRDKDRRRIKFDHSDEEHHMYASQSRNRYDARDVATGVVTEIKRSPYRDESKDSSVNRRGSEKLFDEQRFSKDKNYKPQEDKQSFSVKECESARVFAPKLESETALQKLKTPESEDNKFMPRRESEGREKSSSRRESDVYEKPLSEEESKKQEMSSSRRESKKEEMSLSRRESEKQEMSLSRRESEKREVSLSRRESEKQEMSLSRRESEKREVSLSRRESEKQEMPLSRRESEKREVCLSRRESEKQEMSLSRRESEKREVSLSRRESEKQEMPLSRRESEKQEMSLSRRESEKREVSLSRRESEKQEMPLSRRESEKREVSLSRRESEKQEMSLSRRESEKREVSLSRRESEKQEMSLSRRQSEKREVSLSRRESEKQEMPLSRRESEKQEMSLSRRESEKRETSLSRRESEKQEMSLSRRESEKQEMSSSRRESEISRKSLSKRESTVSESSVPRRKSEVCDQMSRRESESCKKSLSGPEFDGRKHSVPRSEHSDHSAEPKESSEKDVDQESEGTLVEDDQTPIKDDCSSDEPQKLKVEFTDEVRSRSRSPSIPVEESDKCETTDRPVATKERRVKIQEDNKTGTFGQYEHSEQRSTYLTSKSQSIDNDEPSSVHSRDLAVKATHEIMRRQYYERSVDPFVKPTWLQRGEIADSTCIMSRVSENVLRVKDVDFRCMENAKVHNTSMYELVQDIEQPCPVIRRGQTFFMNITFDDRVFDSTVDNAYLSFYFGPNPTVPKRTRVVLPIIPDSDFKRVPYQWDGRMIRQENNTVTMEISVPVSCPVGMWRCVVETSLKEKSTSRLEYSCTDDMYVIFNPFDKDDAVYMADDDQRSEFLFNESGKIYTGSYRNVQGRPWIYGQFDDCILPAACVLLEMSGLSHAERGNPVKITKALTSMIKCSRSGSQRSFDGESTGLIEPMYDDSYCKGNSPYLWTGSIQIIEEFLKLGGSSVKYGQCWVMAGLMTTLCRALGLPARPVTAFVSPVDTQDTMTVDRYLDRFGEIQQDGPSANQTGTLWTYHTWCDVWMHRPDQVPEYSGWQAADPCRIFRDNRNFVKGSCGPCPVEALRKGDLGQKDDVDAFFSSMDAYVRYFYEDEESGWGYSPFNQFKCPVSRYLLTKSVGKIDEEGDDDCEDLTPHYRDSERTEAEKWVTFNSCRGLKDLPAYEYQAAAFNWIDYNRNETDDRNFDVTFDFKTPESVMIGERFTIPVVITNTSSEARTIQTNICTRSSFYTGSLGPYIKRCSRQLTLKPDQCETVSLVLDHWDYEDKLLGMANIKITVTGFVQETHQSFVDEFDFIFKKPFMSIKVADVRVGEDSEVAISFSNPVDVALTDCFLTIEVSGSVRPSTIRLDRDVRPGESFTFTHRFVARKAGQHRMVACFVSQQLTDVVGHRSILVQE